MLLAPIQRYLDRATLRISGGRTTLTGWLAHLPIVMLTTTGAKSGRPRTAPLLAIEDDQRPGVIAVVASNYGQQRHPAWYYNLKATPRATGLIDEQTIVYSAHEAGGDEYARFWQRAQSIYGGYGAYRERATERTIPIMVLTPVDD